MAKYTTLKELSEAFKSGELDESYLVFLDKGGNSISLHQTGPEEGENERYEHCRQLFKREYGEPMTELLEMVSIPCEWC